MKPIISMVTFFVLCLSGCLPFRSVDMVEEVTPSAIDLSKVPNGSYRGNYHVEDIDYQVAVSVVSHRITEIKIFDGMQRVFVKKCALCKVNDLIREIIGWQSLDVDAVSGATQTGNAILNAIENALAPPYFHNGNG